VSRCHILLAIIGPQWLTATDAQGRPRLDNPDDLVRLEIEAALRHDVWVIPIVVEGAALPRQQDLPDILGKLADLHAVTIRHERFRQDAAELVTKIDHIMQEITPRPPRLGAEVNWDGEDRFLHKISNLGGVGFKRISWELEEKFERRYWKFHTEELPAYPLSDLRPGHHATVRVSVTSVPSFCHLILFADMPGDERYHIKESLIAMKL
jgi:hypothetical protein